MGSMICSFKLGTQNSLISRSATAQNQIYRFQGRIIIFINMRKSRWGPCTKLQESV